VLDEDAARAAANAYLAERGFDGEVEMIGDLGVMVTVTETADLAIIPVPDSVTFEVSATAQAIQGPG